MQKESLDRSEIKVHKTQLFGSSLISFGFSLYKARFFILSLVVSAVFLLFLFPLDYLLGLGKYWNNPASEINIALASLRYYITENHWFPLGHISRINFPEGINILYEGAVPLFAFFAKLINRAMGIKINSVYLWSIVCTILQGVSFAYLVTAFNLRRRSIIIVLCSMIGMLMPAYLWRLEHAVALPHFLIIFELAFYFVISRKDNSILVVRRAIILSAILLVISYLLNPYITAMLVPIVFVSILYAISSKKITIFYGISVVISMVLGMVIVGYIFGYFYKNNLAAAVGGFSFFSMNILSPVDIGYGSLFKNFIPNLLPTNPTGGQQEGMQYLGVGWIFLIIAAIFLNKGNTLKSIRDHYLLVIVLSGMSLFALSSKIYFGNTLLLEYSVPKFLVNLVETFRCPGRFFWPMGYLLVAAAIVAIARKTPKSLPFILCFAIILQLSDTHELRQELWNISNGVNIKGKPEGKYDTSYSIAGVPASVMHNLIKNHQIIKQYPSWWCGGLGNQIEEMEINYTASQYLVTQNSFYTARPNKDCYAEDLEARNVSALSSDTLYIFSQRYADPNRLHSQGIDLSSCRVLSSFPVQSAVGYAQVAPIVCSKKIKSHEIDLNTDKPKGWAYKGLFLINLENLTHIKGSG